MKIPVPAVVYSKKLHRSDCGRPLWMPESDVELGDVGVIEKRSGNFIRLFNCLTDSDNPRNSGGVPEKFQPLLLPTHPESPGYIPPTTLLSKTVRKTELKIEAGAGGGGLSGDVGYEFSCSSESGGLLHMDKPADRLQHPATQAFEDYFKANHESWNELLLSKGYKPSDKAYQGPILIRGWIKTKSDWDVVAWVKGSSNHHGTVKINAGHANAGISFSQFTDHESGVPYRSRRALPQSDNRNHCVFVTYFESKGFFGERKVVQRN